MLWIVHRRRDIYFWFPRESTCACCSSITLSLYLQDLLSFVEVELSGLFLLENAFDTVDPVDELPCRQIEIMFGSVIIGELSMGDLCRVHFGRDRMSNDATFGWFLCLHIGNKFQMRLLQLEPTGMKDILVPAFVTRAEHRSRLSISWDQRFSNRLICSLRLFNWSDVWLS